jgi:hypothetical protein
LAALIALVLLLHGGGGPSPRPGEKAPTPGLEEVAKGPARRLREALAAAHALGAGARRETIEGLVKARARGPAGLRKRLAATGAAPPAAAPELSITAGCPLDAGEPGPTLPMSPLACETLADDTAAAPDPIPFWGSIDCASASRYSWIPQGGDNHLTATGELPSGAYRRLTVEDGDDVYGERCELGTNNQDGPTAFYHEGEHLLTYFSERLPPGFPLRTQDWQTLMQMKQAEPEHDGNVGVALQLQVMDGEWFVLDFSHIVWSFPARVGVWTRFAFNVVYSRDPAVGSVQVFADRNDDGDFEDPGERSPVFHGPTLATEESSFAEADGVEAGSGIPSHLRAGIYHDPAISCQAPVDCSVDLANVQVLRKSP